MLTQQYVQHDWPPFLWAAVLLTMATLVVVGMGLFLVLANRPKRHRHSGPQAGRSADVTRTWPVRGPRATLGVHPCCAVRRAR